MTWTGIILAALNAIVTVFNWINEKKWYDAGRDAEIAKQAMAILKMTEAGKEMLAKIEKMPESDLNEFLKELGRD